MLEMKDKRCIVLCTMTFMVTHDVQNTEGDYEIVRNFVAQLIYNYWTQNDLDFKEDEMSKEETSILKPLWEYYFNNLHDGYTVD